MGCLGHQSIAEAFGGKIITQNSLCGKRNYATQAVRYLQDFRKINVARYHSLVIDSISIPTCITVTATDPQGQIMAVRHKHHETYGVQFHPESILTEHGSNIISNFLCDVVGIKSSKMSIPSIPREKRTALKKYIAKAADGINLTEDEAYAAMDIIMSDAATDAQTAAFLAALRMKGETIDEITGFARVMRQKASIVPVSKSAVDIVGTGGDLANSFNISTTSAFVIAGTGLKVAKHGNRSVSSKSGAADVLEALGVKIALSPSSGYLHN